MRIKFDGFKFNNFHFLIHFFPFPPSVPSSRSRQKKVTRMFKNNQNTIFMSESIDEEWTQKADLPKYAVLALVGADSTYWLAITTSIVSRVQNRWEVQWLRKLTGRSWKSSTHAFFNIDNEWPSSSIWRDTVVADLTSFSSKDENDI